ncbi:MAG: DUF6065 family protein [Cyanobacteriota bacterium]|nr:DUF6065 family protein [Cyanobacteriota bacterium]
MTEEISSSSFSSARIEQQFVPPETIPDTLVVPENTIYLIPYDNYYANPTNVEKLGSRRDWFTPYFYFCLPLVFGNQHGFVIKSCYDFIVRWSGSEDIDGVSIHVLEAIPDPNYMLLESHFGSGILTIQTTYMFRTPKNINLMVKEPPNFPVDGFSWMSGVVETDNLRRDFTFNIKITAPERDIYIKKGTPIGCILPYPRYFLDPFQVEELKDPQELEQAQKTSQYFGQERAQFGGRGKAGFRYLYGEDIYGFKFRDHQKTLDMGSWWRSARDKVGKRKRDPNVLAIDAEDENSPDLSEQSIEGSLSPIRENLPTDLSTDSPQRQGSPTNLPPEDPWIDQFFEGI